MSQSLCKIYLHIVFHTKTTSPTIETEHLERVHSYIGQLVNTTGCQVLRVGGTENHIHALIMYIWPFCDYTIMNMMRGMYYLIKSFCPFRALQYCRLLPMVLPRAVGLLPLRGDTGVAIETRDRLLPRLMGGEIDLDGLKGQRAASPEQRFGRNEKHEQTTNAPKGQKN